MDDNIDGCDAVIEDKTETPDAHVDGIVLFADIKPGPLRRFRVARRRREWKRVFGA
jgi:hypothetical protein